MPPVPTPANLLAELADVKRRLRAIETAPQAPNRTQRGGSFRLIPQDGDPASLFTFGGYPNPDTGADEFGVTGYDSKGDIVFALGEADEGLIFPHLYTPWKPAAGASPLSGSGGLKTVTTGSYESVFETYCEIPAHDSLYVLFAYATDGGTVGRVYLDSGTPGQTAAIDLPAGSSGTVRFNWRHPFSVGWGDSDTDATAFVQLMARRSSGAGNVSIYWPFVACWRNRRFANGTDAADGNPTIA